MSQGVMVFKGRDANKEDKLVFECDGGIIQCLEKVAKEVLNILPGNFTLMQIRNILRVKRYKVICIKGSETLDILHPKHNGWFKRNNDLHQKEGFNGSDPADRPE